MAEETGQALWRRRARLIITTALLVIGGLVVMIVAGRSLTPRANAVLALIVFGGMLAAMVVFQRLVGPRDRAVVDDTEPGDDGAI
jgi:hypothetical protein